MINKYKYILLSFVVFIAFVVRILFVSHNPPSLSWDEVSIGYNAYSILLTGRDEHARLFPIDSFIAYGDYKPPIAIYLTIPSVAIFGLSEFAVRFPSVFFGTFTVFFTFFLVNRLLYQYKKVTKVALLTCLVLAISPWHIQLSRAGYEATIALFFIVLGSYFTLQVKINPKYLLFCWVPFIVAFYTFNSSRYAGPLIAGALLLYIFPEIKRNLSTTIAGMILSVVLLIPILPHIFSPEAKLRFVEVNIFSDINIIEKSNARILENGSTWWAKIIHNRRWYYFRSYLSHYLDHFEPRFLFISGDGNPKFSTQQTGQFYLFESVFLIYGFLSLSKLYPRQSLLLLAWMLLAIVPAAMARETPHALRILNSLPTWYIYISFGILDILHRFSSKKLFFSMLILCMYLGGFIYFSHGYLKYYPVEFSGEWQWGYREAITFINSYKDKFNSVVISDSIGRPYMYTLFYTKYNPYKYFNEKKSFFDAAGFYHVSGFGKYLFISGSPMKWEKDTLYVLDPVNVPSNASILNTVYLLNGKPVLVIFKI